VNNLIFEAEGFDTLRQKIKKLPDKVKVREVRKILRRGARPVVKAARDEAPKRTGVGRKSIKATTMTRARVPMIVVGPSSRGKYDGWYLRQFVIPGHNIYRGGFKRNRKGNKAYNATGAKSRVPANPFMDRAKMMTEGKVTRKTLDGMETYLKKQIDRL